jgi:hypothetical protein
MARANPSRFVVPLLDVGFSRGHEGAVAPTRGNPRQRHRKSCWRMCESHREPDGIHSVGPRAPRSSCSRASGTAVRVKETMRIRGLEMLAVESCIGGPRSHGLWHACRRAVGMCCPRARRVCAARKGSSTARGGRRAAQRHARLRWPTRKSGASSLTTASRSRSRPIVRGRARQLGRPLRGIARDGIVSFMSRGAGPRPTGVMRTIWLTQRSNCWRI